MLEGDLGYEARHLSGDVKPARKVALLKVGKGKAIVESERSAR
jgi:hypothetical protein